MAAAEATETLVEILDPSPSSSSSSSSSELDLAKYVSFVRDPTCGAIATFEGTTRDSFDGKAVVELRYEAYVPMALRQLRSICDSARSRYSVRRLAVAHRLGTVPPGEASVFVAASAVHRADALEACRFLIDEIKASVPIWKKEVYADGEVWKENKEFGERKGCCCGSKVKEEGSAES